MTVKELYALLGQLPADMEVTFYAEDSGYGYIGACDPYAIVDTEKFCEGMYPESYKRDKEKYADTINQKYKLLLGIDFYKEIDGIELLTLEQWERLGNDR